MVERRRWSRVRRISLLLEIAYFTVLSEKGNTVHGDGNIKKIINSVRCGSKPKPNVFATFPSQHNYHECVDWQLSQFRKNSG
jgi:hypothetical protein